MIDTIKLLVPITESQYIKIMAVVLSQDHWNWGRFNPNRGEIHVMRYQGIAKTDSASFHREIRYAVPDRWHPDSCLVFEFSLPKFWYGHNIYLLYDWLQALEEFRTKLNQQFGLKTRSQLPAIADWKVSRADCCYAWTFPSQSLAQGFLDSLKPLKFPYKAPTIRRESLFFPGRTYSVKVYLKLPEFLAHDRKMLLKQQATLEWVNHLESIADGVLRFEVTLRQQWLKRNGIVTVSDLAQVQTIFEWQHEAPSTEEETATWVCALSILQLHKDGVNHITEEMLLEDCYPLLDGQVLSSPAGNLTVRGKEYEVPEISAIVRRVQTPTRIIQVMLNKFVGEGLAVRTVDKVQTRLLDFYKPNKASRLTAFWLFVQRFGSERAKADFGKESYYQARSDLKQAGIALIDMTKAANETVVSQEFMEQFRMIVPSPHVTNKLDDFRDSGNILNFRPRDAG